MSYFYADGKTKDGTRLITSYKKQEQAARYRVGAKITQGEKFLNIQEDGSAKLSSSGDLLVRTLMIRPEDAVKEVQQGGPFVVYAKIDGVWQRTSFRYKNYASANAAVKSALINLYEACAIIETDEDDIPAKPMAVDTSVDEEAPF